MPKNILMIGPTGCGQHTTNTHIHTHTQRETQQRSGVTQVRGAAPGAQRVTRSLTAFIRPPIACCRLSRCSYPCMSVLRVSGKTEIARRLARLTDSPFLKVEATKFTEIGFHGRDVDSIISDLVRVAISTMKGKRKRQLRDKVKERVEDKLLDALTGPGGNRVDFLQLLRANLLDQQEIEIEIPVRPPGQQQGSGGIGGLGLSSLSGDESSPSSSSSERVLEFALRGLSGGSGGMKGGRKELRKLLIADARPLLEESEYEQFMSNEDVTKEALKAVEDDGIVFIDEIDKICSPPSAHKYADASAEGVQRDLLPLIEGTTITTKQGDVKTDHILFIASGAFHAVKPSDLMAELQVSHCTHFSARPCSLDAAAAYRSLSSIHHAPACQILKPPLYAVPFDYVTGTTAHSS